MPGDLERHLVHDADDVPAGGLGDSDLAWVEAALEPEQVRDRTNRRGLCHETVLVDQPAESVAAADAIEIDHLADWLVDRRRQPERRPLRE